MEKNTNPDTPSPKTNDGFRMPSLTREQIIAKHGNMENFLAWVAKERAKHDKPSSKEEAPTPKDKKYDSSKSGERPNIDRREKKIKVTLFEGELKSIEEKAFQESKRVATYVRDSALKRPLPKARFTEHELKLLKDLPKIGGNLNQISRSLNRGESLSEELADRLHSALEFINNIKSRFDK